MSGSNVILLVAAAPDLIIFRVDLAYITNYNVALTLLWMLIMVVS